MSHDPQHILVIKGLTLPEFTSADHAAVQEAAGPQARITVVERIRDAIEVAADVDVILGLIPERLFAATPELRWVHAIASGVDSFLYPAFRDSPVVLTGEKGLVGGHLADTGWGLLLALTRQIATALRLAPHSWPERENMRKREIELEGMTMGVFGFGGTGRHMARRAVAFGMDVIAMDEHPVPPSDGVAQVEGPGFFEELLRRSDVVAVCSPLTPATRGVFDAKAFGLMKPTAYIVNVTRGEIIDGDALVAALEAGQIAGAALDVAPIEPLPEDHPLWSMPNVAMTPHTAGASQLRGPRNVARFCDNLRRLRAGDELTGVVDKHAGY
ncbi:MAG: D-2-hydroxyacid dehydrogenase [Acidimicrobiales bacterium]